MLAGHGGLTNRPEWLRDSRPMFELRHFITILQRVAFGCTALVLILLSVSGGQRPIVGGGLAVQAWCQAVGFRAQNLRRPTSVQTRSATVAQSTDEVPRSSTLELPSTGLARMHERELLLQATYRLILSQWVIAHETPIDESVCSLTRARAPPWSAA